MTLRIVLCTRSTTPTAASSFMPYYTAARSTLIWPAGHSLCVLAGAKADRRRSAGMRRRLGAHFQCMGRGGLAAGHCWPEGDFCRACCPGGMTARRLGASAAAAASGRALGRLGGMTARRLALPAYGQSYAPAARRGGGGAAAARVGCRAAGRPSCAARPGRRSDAGRLAGLPGARPAQPAPAAVRLPGRLWSALTSAAAFYTAAGSAPAPDGLKYRPFGARPWQVLQMGGRFGSL